MLSEGERSKEQRSAERSDRRIHAYNSLDREQQRSSDSRTRLARATYLLYPNDAACESHLSSLKLSPGFLMRSS